MEADEDLVGVIVIQVLSWMLAGEGSCSQGILRMCCQMSERKRNAKTCFGKPQSHDMN